MRSLLLSLAALAGWFATGLPSSGEEPETHASTAQVKTDLTTVIESQLAAFRMGDFGKAYTFAASEVRGVFSATQFEKMVKAGYPVIAHSEKAEFGLFFDTGDEAVVNVVVRDADKKGVPYQYHLKKEPAGWKIIGVEEVKPDSLSV